MFVCEREKKTGVQIYIEEETVWCTLEMCVCVCGVLITDEQTADSQKTLYEELDTTHTHTTHTHTHTVSVAKK